MVPIPSVDGSRLITGTLCLLLAAIPGAVPAGSTAGSTDPLPAATTPDPKAFLIEVERFEQAENQAVQRQDFAAALRSQRDLLVWLEAHAARIPAHAQPVLRALTLTRLGGYLVLLDQPEEGEQALGKAVSLWRGMPGEQPVLRLYLAYALTQQGGSLRALGRPQDALAPLHESGNLLLELAKTDRRAWPILAGTLMVMATVSSELGQTVEAWRASELALQMLNGLQAQSSSEPALGAALESLVLAGAINLPTQLGDVGQHEQAVTVARGVVQATRARARAQAGPSADLALALTNLGQALGRDGAARQERDEGKEAERLYREALSATEEARAILTPLARQDPQQLPSLITLLTNQGLLQAILTREPAALETGAEAVRLARALERSTPRERPVLAGALIGLAGIEMLLAKPGQALVSSQEAVRILQDLSRSNRSVQSRLSTGLGLQAAAELALGRTARALPMLQEGLVLQMTQLQEQLPLLPEGRRLALLETTFNSSWQVPFSLAGQGEDADRLALFTRLNRQGLLQDIQRRQALMARDSASGQKARTLAAMTMRLASTTLTPQQQRELQPRRDSLELELYGTLPALRPRLVQPGELAGRLPARGLLLEFQRFEPFDPLQPPGRQFGSPRYLALLLHPDGRIRSVPLGEAAGIDATIASALAAAADPREDAQLQARQRLRQVSERVFGPLAGALRDVRELFLSLDGELNRVPIAALPAPESADRSMGETFELRLLTSGRDLLRLSEPGPPGGPSALIADPDFGHPTAATAQAPGSDGPQLRSPDGHPSGHWPALPGTALEAQLLAPLLGVRQPITGRRATTGVVLRQQAPRVLHIATHGFFLADQPTAGSNPLLRSGLVFSGANRPDADPGDDGYLTAAEATAMALDGTELVTLSACETGLGAVLSGEGVYGLQRALMVAGSRSTLLSLWKVPDELTARFMQTYYGHLRRGEGRAEALIHTQREFRDSRDSSLNDIHAWGAFQLTGDWRPIPGWGESGR